MTRNTYSVPELEARARVLRRHVVRLVEKVKIGYLQQGLGAADIFAALYFGELRLRENDPDWPGRDRCILSTAHNTAVFYATLVERGLLPPALLDSYTDDGSALEVNASERVGALVEATCGSLGQGLSVAVGMALSVRRQKLDSRVYVILGDGELQEGQVWEAALAAAGHDLDNLCMIIDRNCMQVEGHTDKVVRMDPVGAKFAAFGWHAVDIDGNDMGQLTAALDAARGTRGKPTLIVANTLAGSGVPFLEGQLAHLARLTPEDAARAMAILDEVPA
ncbi:transketolase [Phenylobacterium hankyongense]|uniref:Transketolase n=1 Tax=Phenylobacterium hankyongense TaxID=1813876 RepID=A0A328AZZ4_9CAUL|nr:transketolase [Phenylobacterium hankyongense]RAK60690.1 transketolase [Phenylobacterium hankyongense]